MNKIIRVKADIHPDGDVYVYNPKKKEYQLVGILLPHNDTGFMFLHNADFGVEGDLISIPAINPCYRKAKRISNINK